MEDLLRLMLLLALPVVAALLREHWHDDREDVDRDHVNRPRQ
jgi:hypothetical protein